MWLLCILGNTTSVNSAEQEKIKSGFKWTCLSLEDSQDITETKWTRQGQFTF